MGWKSGKGRLATRDSIPMGCDWSVRHLDAPTTFLLSVKNPIGAQFVRVRVEESIMPHRLDDYAAGVIFTAEIRW